MQSWKVHPLLKDWISEPVDEGNTAWHLKKIQLDSTTSDYMTRLGSELTIDLQRQFRDFYVEAAKQMRAKFILIDPIVRDLKCLSQIEVFKKTPDRFEISRLLNRFVDFVSPRSNQACIENEWQLIKDHEFPVSSVLDLDVDEFWTLVSKDHSKQFEKLANFMLKSCSLRVETAEVERIFSKLIKKDFAP